VKTDQSHRWSHVVDSFAVDIMMPSCSLDESDPLKFMSTESFPDSNSSKLHAFQIGTQGLDDLVCTSANLQTSGNP